MNYWETCPHGLPAIDCAYCTSAKTRAETIEECARKIDQMVTSMTLPEYADILAVASETIRGLKDKPNE